MVFMTNKDVSEKETLVSTCSSDQTRDQPTLAINIKKNGRLQFVVDPIEDDVVDFHVDYQVHIRDRPFNLKGGGYGFMEKM